MAGRATWHLVGGQSGRGLDRQRAAEGRNPSLDGLAALGKAEPNMAAAELAVCVEARCGHGRHGRSLDQMPSEGHIVQISEALDPSHDVVRAGWRVDFESALSKA